MNKINEAPSYSKVEIANKAGRPCTPNEATRVQQQTKFLVKFDNNVKIPSLSSKSEFSENTKKKLTSLSNRFSQMNDNAKPIQTNILNWQLEDNTSLTEKRYKSIAELYELPFLNTLEENNHFYASGCNPKYASVNPYLKGIIEFLSPLNEHDITSQMGLKWENKLKMMSNICSNMPYKSNISDSLQMCPKLNKDVLFSVFNMMSLEEQKARKCSKLQSQMATSVSTKFSVNQHQPKVPELKKDSAALKLLENKMARNNFSVTEIDLVSPDNRDRFDNELKTGASSTKYVPGADNIQQGNNLPVINLQKIFSTLQKQEQDELVSELASVIINVLLNISFFSLTNKKLVKLGGQKHSMNDPDYLLFKYINYMTPVECTVNDDNTSYSTEQLQGTQMFQDLQSCLYNRLKDGFHISDMAMCHKMIKLQYHQFLNDIRTATNKSFVFDDYKLTMFDLIFTTTLDLAYNEKCQFPIIKTLLKPTMRIIIREPGKNLADPRKKNHPTSALPESIDLEIIGDYTFQFKQIESSKKLNEDQVKIMSNRYEDNTHKMSAVKDSLEKQKTPTSLMSIDIPFPIIDDLSAKDMSISSESNGNYYEEGDIASRQPQSIFSRLEKISSEQSILLDKIYVHPDDEDWEQHCMPVQQTKTVFERLGRRSETDISDICPSPKRPRSCNRS